MNRNISLQDVNTNSWRNILGVVPQDIHIFNGNVLDNICLGDTQMEAENILKFISEFGFEKYIAGFPQGFLTILGEEGINLSGGQKQVIALARALYRKPQVLILDEATAAMDRETEKFTIDLLNKLKKNVAVFYISHRLHVLKNMSDRIYILRDGKIQDEGTHQELLLGNNMYSNYWKDLALV